MKHCRLKTTLAGLLVTCMAFAVQSGDQNELYAQLPFSMKKVVCPQFPDKTVDIRNFGAKGDGRTLNTDAIAKAIAQMHKAGGGTVVIPEGLWVTGPIELKSNVRLHTKRGAVVMFTDDFDRYPLVKTYYEGQEGWRNMSPLYACDATNIAITGEGIFDGNGNAWRPVKKSNVTSYQWREFVESGGQLSSDGAVWYPTQRALYGSQVRSEPRSRSMEQAMAIKEYLRPVLLNFIRCKTVMIEGPIFRNSPAWCLHPLLCENLTIRNVMVENESWAANGDAIDVESCRNVIITDCSFDAGDDGICMKSGKDEEGRNRGVPTENVIVSGCKVYNGHGGFVVGSEMSGGVRNVFVKDCQFIGTDNGLRFKSTRGRGGVVENIHIQNVLMANIKSDAILYDLYYGGRRVDADSLVKVSEITPSFRNIYMKDIVCKGARRAAIFQGLPEMKLKNIRLENAVIESDSGVDVVDAENILFKNVSVYVKGKNPIIIHKERDIIHQGLDSDLSVNK
jgi:polygalacturonase